VVEAAGDLAPAASGAVEIVSCYPYLISHIITRILLSTIPPFTIKKFAVTSDGARKEAYFT
jgi:hypothetical protein